ncbi:MAG: DUF5060 domain-containing protein [Bacteroidota bacterium]
MRLKAAMHPVMIIMMVCSLTTLKAQKIEGELKQWHKVTLIFDGPECSETDEYNPFFNYRLNVLFEHKASGKKYTIPGYFAADGNAGETSATSGNKWKVHFAPDETGEWNYSVEFVKDEWAAIRNWREKDLPGGEYMDGKSGKITISSTDKTGKDFRAHGRLQYVGEGYLKFAETGGYFFKCGPDSPENFLSYYAFDGDFVNDGHKDNLVKKWEAHLRDWKEGDPTWKNGKGKEIIGAMNYLVSKGMNSVSFLTNNVNGDDRNVFPYIDYDTWDRFDCSRLDQWEIVFTHAQENGIFLHFKTLEHENQGLLDNGAIGANTKLYYRELIARFGHHLALNWNLCEEIGDWADHGTPSMPLDVNQRRALSEYIYDTDAYHHHMVIHNGEWFTPMYGDQSKLTGASLQTSREDFSLVHDQVSRVIIEAKNAGKIWAVACDEPGDYRYALIPDEVNPDHFNARTNGLWGAMLAGAWGTEWYFGYEYPHSDLTCEDWRSRDLFWDMGKICLDFFYNNNDIPVNKMTEKDELISSDGDYCYALEGDTYIILLKNGGESTLDLKNNKDKYSVVWYDTRNGGELQTGEVKSIQGGGKKSLGLPPNNVNKDWVVLVRNIRQ